MRKLVPIIYHVFTYRFHPWVFRKSFQNCWPILLWEGSLFATVKYLFKFCFVFSLRRKSKYYVQILLGYFFLGQLGYSELFCWNTVLLIMFLFVFHLRVFPTLIDLIFFNLSVWIINMILQTRTLQKITLREVPHHLHTHTLHNHSNISTHSQCPVDNQSQ